MVTLPRLYAIADTATLVRREVSLRVALEAFLEGGARLIQLRHKGHFTRELFGAAKEASELCRSAGARFVIDDRADVALLLDAGLHLGQDDLPLGEVRRWFGEGFAGLSTHNRFQLEEADAEPADYLAIGPIFATGSKANPDPVVGLEELARLRAVTAKPLVAIGGIARDNAAAVLAAGADSVAVISELLPEAVSKASIRARVEEWRGILGDMV